MNHSGSRKPMQIMINMHLTSTLRETQQEPQAEIRHSRNHVDHEFGSKIIKNETTFQWEK